jgi:hypothetical protein
MPSVEYDLRYLKAGASSLENYLLSNDLYWPIGASPPAGEPPYPRLTLGAIQIAQKRSHARSLSAEQQAELSRLDELIDAIRARWRSAWKQKAAAEFRSRLNLWRNYIQDYRSNPEGNVDRYAYEVGRRVQLQLLDQEVDDLPETEMKLLDGLDKFLLAVLIPGPFIWESQLEAAFPRDIYWYLYGKPKSGQ